MEKKESTTTHLSLHNQSDGQCNCRIVGEFQIIGFHGCVYLRCHCRFEKIFLFMLAFTRSHYLIF